MNLTEINQKVNDLTNNWKKFSEEQKSNNHIHKLEEKLNQMQTALMRPDVSCNSATSVVKQQLEDFIRTGKVPDLHTKSFNSSNEDEGKFLVTPELFQHIISKITCVSPMRKLASTETISSNALDIIMQDGSFDVGWVDEIEERKNTDAPKLIQKRITVHELYAQPSTTRKLLDDSAIDLASWLTERLVDSFAKAENQSFIIGDGVKQPKGILTNEEIQLTTSEDKGVISPEDLLNIINALDENYLPNATFLMNRTTLSQIQKLKDNTGRFIWQPSMSSAAPETLFGLPVVCCNDMPKAITGKLAIAIADFKQAYKIVDRAHISFMQDPYTHKPFIKFYAVKRVGGDVVDCNAIKLLKVQ